MIREKIQYFLLIAFVATWVGCADDAANAGASALLEEDNIQVKADTFAVASELNASAAISLTPDSFLLGECDTHFGTIKADILTQLACPVGFEYPYAETAEVDSICLYLYYTNWYGDGMAPMGITVYEMDKATLDYNTRYPSDTALSTFCSMADSTKIAAVSRVIVAAEPTDSIEVSDGVYTPYVRIKLSDEFAKRFFAINDFSSQEQFNQLFKGLYIASDFGGSTVLYVTNISMAVYYHFSYPRQSGDTVVNDVKGFYANSEVRQVNRYIYPDREQVMEDLAKKTDTNFVVSPANIYTRLSINMDSVVNRMEEQLGDPSGYRVYVNRANITVDVLYDVAQDSDRPRDQWDTPASYMLLVLEDKMESFFAKNELPSDTVAILSPLSAAADTLGNISYSYTFDLSGMLTQQLRAEEKQEALHFLLVPVSVEGTASTTVSSVKQLQTISTTYIRSADNSEQPMDIEMVYAGFNTVQH